jgi:hypothetical protein
MLITLIFYIFLLFSIIKPQNLQYLILIIKRPQYDRMTISFISSAMYEHYFIDF